MYIKINDLEFVENNETEDIYYFNDRMLKEGIFIRYNTCENPDIELGQKGCIDSYLEVGCLNDDRTFGGYYILYWDSLLSGIQVYRMIKDIYELYVMSANKQDFIEVLEQLSISYRDSSLKGRSGLVKEIKQEIETIRQIGL